MWTWAKTGTVRALTDLIVPAQSLPGTPHACPQPRTPLQPIPEPSVPTTGVLTSSSPHPCPSTSSHQASPTCWLMSWCGLRSAPSPWICLTMWADTSFPPSPSLPCSPLSEIVGPVPGQRVLLAGLSSSFQPLKELLLRLPPDRFRRKTHLERSCLQMFQLDHFGNWSHLSAQRCLFYR